MTHVTLSRHLERRPRDVAGKTAFPAAANETAHPSYAFAMTTPAAQTLLSVRGQAQRAVDADQASIHAAVSQTRATKGEAASEVSALLATVVDELANLGGVVLTAQSNRAP